MARSTTLVAFIATVGMAVPAGWHLLGASIHSEARKLRPHQQTVMVDGADVTLDIDKGIVTTGDAVVATLRATASERKRVAVDLYVTQSNNYEGARVETPDIKIDHERITLEAAPGGGPAFHTKLVLGKAQDATARIDNFTIAVLPRGAGLETDGEVASARATVLRWSGNTFDMSIQTQGKVTDSAPFKVVVRVENTTGKRLSEPYIELGTQLAMYGLDAGEQFAFQDVDAEHSDEDRYDDEGMPKKTWKPGQVRKKTFIVTPTGEGAEQIKQVTFVARANVWFQQPGPVIAGAMDAHTFDVKHVESAPEVTPAVAKN